MNILGMLGPHRSMSRIPTYDKILQVKVYAPLCYLKVVPYFQPAPVRELAEWPQCSCPRLPSLIKQGLHGQHLQGYHHLHNRMLFTYIKKFDNEFDTVRIEVELTGHDIFYLQGRALFSSSSADLYNNF